MRILPVHSCICAFVHYLDVIHRLEQSLKAPLPGASAHAILAPRPRRQWPEGFNPAAIRHAAGLLLVFPIGDRAHTLLTLRAGTLGRHGGQVSLPGGIVERGETFEQTALREAQEEVGLPAAATRIVGPLTPIDIPVSGFRLHPIVGTTVSRPMLTPADGEVAAILEVDIADLFQQKHVATTERERDGRIVVTPSFLVDDLEIWGATAMILAEFLVLLGWEPQLS